MVRCLVAVILVSALSAQQAPEALFDGKSLAGWRGDPALWRVEAGCIVGSTVGQERRRTTYLHWQGEPAVDFELTYRLRVEGANNSGVQYRSRELENFDVAGLQCDAHPKPEYFGMFYEEKGVGVLCQHGQFVARDTEGNRRVVDRIATPPGEPVDLAQWHTFKVVARGNVIEHYADGRLVAMLMDDKADAPRGGSFALQVHAGPEMTAWFKDIALVRLPREELAATPPLARALLEREKGKASEGPDPEWIWDAEAGGEEDLFFRRAFDLDGAIAAADVVVACDNKSRVYVNGARVLESSDWAAPSRAAITEHLVPGKNVIAVHAWNEGGPAALALRVSWRSAKGDGGFVTDASWRCSNDDPEGWNGLEFAEDDTWDAARSFGAVGKPGLPWSPRLRAINLAPPVPPDAPQVALPAMGLAGPGAAGAIELLDVPRGYGSWVAICADDEGRLIASDQSRGLYRVTPADGLGGESRIEKLDVDLDGAQGLCWFRDSLYAVVSYRTPGLYRLRDTDGDDAFDEVTLLRELKSGGEHGPHAIMPAPDGENLLVVIGNHVPLTAIGDGLPQHEWGEDRLLEKFEDPRGHARGLKAPGGYICKVDPNGENWELLSWGFRNTYDAAVLPDGRIYTYDADMEWDMGMPWYRPTRILEVVPGVDYGWRSGSNKWPADYPDAPASICDIGPGSPTAMVLHHGSVLAFDWTFGTIWALPVGGREPVQWVTGEPFPVSDACSVDGKLYVLTGGRGLKSRLLRIDAIPPYALGSPAPAIWRDEPVELRRLRTEIRDATVTPGHALARLATFDFGGLGREARISWVRAHALALLAMDEIGADVRDELTARLLPLLPTGDGRVDADLVEVLTAIDAPGLLDRAVPLLAEVKFDEPPAWTDVVTRNARYGGPIQKMIDEMPPTSQIAIAYALVHVDNGWTLDQRATLFSFLAAARTRKGGASYDGYLKRMIDYAWERCSPAEQNALADLADKARADLPTYRATKPKGPGRDWQLADAQAEIGKGLQNADLVAGHNLFHATGCAACHYFAGEGGNHGPDLTSLGNKFSANEVLEAILEPDNVISDQYSGSVVTTTSRAALLGRAVKVTHEGAEVWEVMPAVADARLQRFPVADVKKVEPSKKSPMPAGLVDALNPEELRDLLAFLLSRGVR